MFQQCINCWNSAFMSWTHFPVEVNYFLSILQKWSTRWLLNVIFIQHESPTKIQFNIQYDSRQTLSPREESSWRFFSALKGDQWQQLRTKGPHHQTHRIANPSVGFYSLDCRIIRPWLSVCLISFSRRDDVHRHWRSVFLTSHDH